MPYDSRMKCKRCEGSFLAVHLNTWMCIACYKETQVPAVTHVTVYVTVVNATEEQVKETIDSIVKHAESLLYVDEAYGDVEHESQT